MDGKRPQDITNVMNCGCWYLARGCSGLGTNLAASLQCNPATPTSAGTRRCDSLPMLPFRVTGDIPGPGDSTWADWRCWVLDKKACMSGSGFPGGRGRWRTKDT